MRFTQVRIAIHNPLTTRKMKSLQKSIDTLKASLAAARQFIDQYGSKLPDDFPGFFSMADVVYGDGKPKFQAVIPDNLRNDGNRETLLCAVGDIFGREGWIRNLSNDRKSFDWTKEIAGVKIQIMDAERIDEPRDKTPVRAAEFPLLLGSTEEVQS